MIYAETVAATAFRRTLGYSKESDERSKSKKIIETKEEKAIRTGVAFTVQVEAAPGEKKTSFAATMCARDASPRIGTSVRSTLGGRRNAGRKQTASGRERREREQDDILEASSRSRLPTTSLANFLSLGCMCSLCSNHTNLQSVTALLVGNSTLEIIDRLKFLMTLTAIVSELIPR